MLCSTVSVDLLVYGLSACRRSLLRKQCWFRAEEAQGCFSSRSLNHKLMRRNQTGETFFLSANTQKGLRVHLKVCYLMFTQRLCLPCHITYGSLLLSVLLPDATGSLKPDHKHAHHWRVAVSPPKTKNSCCSTDWAEPAQAIKDFLQLIWMNVAIKSRYLRMRNRKEKHEAGESIKARHLGVWRKQNNTEDNNNSEQREILIRRH